MLPARRRFYRLIVDRAAQRYLHAGRSAYHFAHAKLLHDPFFASVLAHGLFAGRIRLADLGCGQGLLFALLIEAWAQYESGAWSGGWPTPPNPASLVGIDLRRPAIRAAQHALGERAHLRVGDVRNSDLKEQDAIVLVDVLHYMRPAEQEAVLGKCRRALTRGGQMVVRIADADAGLKFRITKLSDQVATAFRSGTWPYMHSRGLSEWTDLLESMEMHVRAEPMSAGTPYSNVLLIAQPR